MTEKESAPTDGGGVKVAGGGTPGGGGVSVPGGTPGGGPATSGGGVSTPPVAPPPDPYQHTWVQAQDEMLKEMTQDQKTAYFTSSSEAQNQAVQDWHQARYGTTTSTEMPHGGPIVEGKYMPGGKG